MMSDTEQKNGNTDVSFHSPSTNSSRKKIDNLAFVPNNGGNDEANSNPSSNSKTFHILQEIEALAQENDYVFSPKTLAFMNAFLVERNRWLTELSSGSKDQTSFQLTFDTMMKRLDNENNASTLNNIKAISIFYNSERKKGMEDDPKFAPPTFRQLLPYTSTVTIGIEQLKQEKTQDGRPLYDMQSRPVLSCVIKFGKPCLPTDEWTNEVQDRYNSYKAQGVVKSMDEIVLDMERDYLFHVPLLLRIVRHYANALIPFHDQISSILNWKEVEVEDSSDATIGRYKILSVRIEDSVIARTVIESHANEYDNAFIPAAVLFMKVYLYEFKERTNKAGSNLATLAQDYQKMRKKCADVHKTFNPPKTLLELTRKYFVTDSIQAPIEIQKEILSRTGRVVNVDSGVFSKDEHSGQVRPVLSTNGWMQELYARHQLNKSRPPIINVRDIAKGMENDYILNKKLILYGAEVKQQPLPSTPRVAHLSKMKEMPITKTSAKKTPCPFTKRLSLASGSEVKKQLLFSPSRVALSSSKKWFATKSSTKPDLFSQMINPTTVVPSTPLTAKPRKTTNMLMATKDSSAKHLTKHHTKHQTKPTSTKKTPVRSKLKIASDDKENVKTSMPSCQIKFPKFDTSPQQKSKSNEDTPEDTVGTPVYIDYQPEKFCGRFLQDGIDYVHVHVGNGFYLTLKLSSLKMYTPDATVGQIHTPVMINGKECHERWVFNGLYWVCVPFKKAKMVGHYEGNLGTHRLMQNFCSGVMCSPLLVLL